MKPNIDKNISILRNSLPPDKKAEIESQLPPVNPTLKDDGLTKETKNEKIERILNAEFSFRFNDIKQKPEFRLINSQTDFEPVDKYFLNTLKRKLDRFGIQTSTDNIKAIIESEFSERINPIQNYFTSLQEYAKSEPDYIKKLCDTVQVVESNKWYEYVKKWLVGVVANAMDNHICRNHLCLVITGEQGTFKTSWLENLCPKSLNQYLYTGKIDPTNKDTLTYIAEYLFVNIDDQLRSLNKKDENELKNLITVNKVKYRRPYDPYILEYPHLCSFMASVNGNEFLTDPTGSRRFLPFEVKKIDIEKAQKINMDDVYRQAMQLWRNKFNYWLSDVEVLELHKYNERFQVVSIEEELIIEYFDIPGIENHKEEANIFLTTSMIKTKLERITQQRLSSKKLGEALTKIGAVKWQKTEDKHRKWVYSLYEKLIAEAEDSNRNLTHQSSQFPVNNHG